VDWSSEADRTPPIGASPGAGTNAALRSHFEAFHLRTPLGCVPAVVLWELGALAPVLPFGIIREALSKKVDETAYLA
jgi:hypothetical protein